MYKKFLKDDWILKYLSSWLIVTIISLNKVDTVTQNVESKYITQNI